MSIPERTKEIVTSIKSCEKKAYRRDEALQELLELQSEFVSKTFSEEHADYASLKLRDVANYFISKNEELEFTTRENVRAFKEECFNVENLIRSYISGQNGERKVSKVLYSIEGDKKLLRNVELALGDERSEIDDILITHKGIFIIEVKNTKRDVFIDVNGDLYRKGEHTYLDQNIGKKMEIREHLVSSFINGGCSKEVPILKVLVYTNNGIKIQNKYQGFYSCCFLQELPYVIEDYSGEDILSLEEMEELYELLNVKNDEREYPLEIDINAFKMHFAKNIATLEQASSDAYECEDLDEVGISIADEQVNSECIGREKTEKKKKIVAIVVSATSIGAIVAYTLKKCKQLRR